MRISTVFQHCRRAFLLHCSTLCMLFYYTPVLYSSTVCVHFCYIQALFWLHLHTFVCVSFNACIPFIIFKRNGDLTGSPCWWPIRMERCNAVRSLSVLLCRWKSVPLFCYLAVCVHFCEGEGVPSFAYAYFFISIYRWGSHHVDFLTLGSMCLLIFIISTLTFRSRSC